MKKRSIFTIALAIALTAAISVGATLAFLTARDNKVTNTFSFANGMAVTLSEPDPRGEDGKTKEAHEEITENGKGWQYDNVTPGQKLNKAPQVVATTTVDSYVFVEITGASEMVYPINFNSAWKHIEGTGTGHGTNGIYYRTVNVGEDATIEGTEDQYDLGSIFTQVQTSENATKDTDLGDIVIKVFEIQQEGLTVETATAQAQDHFTNDNA